MSSRVRQFTLLPPPSLKHRGDTRIGRRKIARPFDPNRSIHVVLKSSRARGEWSMLHGMRREAIETLTRKVAKRFGITIDRRGFANVGTHLHLILRANHRRSLRGFLRVLAGSLVMLITRSRKSHPLSAKFWDQTPFSRVVSWARDLETLRNYLIKNLFEAEGLIDRKGKDKDIQVISLAKMAGVYSSKRLHRTQTVKEKSHAQDDCPQPEFSLRP